MSLMRYSSHDLCILCTPTYAYCAHNKNNDIYNNKDLKDIIGVNMSKIYGVGYNSKGKHKTMENYKQTKAYVCWLRMLQRCYSEELHSRQPSYTNCEIDQSWFDFQVFADWYQDNYVEGYFLDKDLLAEDIGKGSLYSKDTCMFLPSEVNNIIRNPPRKGSDLPLGVVYNKTNRNYRAVIKTNGKRLYVKSCKTKEEAHTLYLQLKIKVVEEMILRYDGIIALQLSKYLSKLKSKIQ